MSSVLSLHVATAEEETGTEEVTDTIPDTEQEDIDEIDTDTPTEDLVEDEQDASIEQESPVETDDLSTEGEAYAILTGDGDLIFFRSTSAYTNESTNTVNLNGIAYTGTVYTKVETSYTSRWSGSSTSIKRAYVASGYTIKPQYMTSWFSAESKMTSFDATGFDTSQTTDMSGLFSSCSSLTTLNLSSFDTSNVTTMRSMFNGCSSLRSLNLSGFNTSNVTTMYGMFGFCSSLTSLDLSSFDTSNVMNMEGMFRSCSSLTSLNLNNFVTSKVTSMDSMFAFCSSLTSLDLSYFDTSKTTNMAGMLCSCTSLLELNLSSFDTSKITTMRSMFDLSPINKVILGPKFTKWTNESYLPEGTWNHGDLSKTETELYQQYPSHASEWAGIWTKNMPLAGTAYAILMSNGNMIFFRSDETYNNGTAYTVTIDGNSYSGIVYSGIETISASSNSDIPWYTDREFIKTVRVAQGQTIKPISTAYWFYGCSNMTSFDGTGFDTSDTTKMQLMFNGCSSLTSLDISSFNTSKVSRDGMSYMFNGCSSLASLNLSNFDTSNVTNMSGMFTACSSLTSLNVSSFNTSKVEKMTSMFRGCSSLESLNVSNFNTLNVTNMNTMFNNCSSLTALDLSGFRTSKATGMKAVFYGCSSLNSLDISGFNTSNVTQMDDMFGKCDDLSSVKLGTGFTKWISNAYLPEGTWYHGDLYKTEVELYNQYPLHADEWDGKWRRDVSLFFDYSSGFELGVNNNSFMHDGNYFFSIWNNEFIIDDRFWSVIQRINGLNILDNRIKRTMVNYPTTEIDKFKFAGVCYGISAVMDLVFYDKYRMSDICYFPPLSNHFYDKHLSDPEMNAIYAFDRDPDNKFLNYIMYYFLSQYFYEYGHPSINSYYETIC